MAFLEWNDSLSVRVEKFDTQHKGLIRIINGLHDAMVKGKGKEALGGILDGLIDYTVNHFSEEETAMGKYGYPGLGLHKLEHKKLTEQVLAFKDKYSKGEQYISIEIMLFLKDWLVNHIMGTDKQYGDFFAEKGIRI